MSDVRPIHPAAQAAANIINRLERERDEWRSLYQELCDINAANVARIESMKAALEDISLVRIPGAPDGVTVGMDQFGPFARQRAKEALWAAK